MFSGGILISQKSYLNRKKEELLEECSGKIRSLERMHKVTPTQKIRQKLDNELSKLKLLEASQAAKDIMLGKQRVFKYRNKPNRCLAKLLQEKEEFRIPYQMMTPHGEVTVQIRDKLTNFENFHEYLYYSSGSNEINMNTF